jgi:hypothetical protein
MNGATDNRRRKMNDKALLATGIVIAEIADREGETEAKRAAESPELLGHAARRVIVALTKDTQMSIDRARNGSHELPISAVDEMLADAEVNLRFVKHVAEAFITEKECEGAISFCKELEAEIMELSLAMRQRERQMTRH